jgi:hypothetical protein
MDSMSIHRPRRSAASRLFAPVAAGVLLAATVGFSAEAARPLELRLANQPNTTQTGGIIKSGYDSTGDSIKVEIINPATNAVVDTNAQVTLSRYYYPSGGTVSGGGPVTAVHGVATFPNLSINVAGAYKLRATSPAASNAPITNLFMVADVVETCANPSCSFTSTQGGSSYLVDPNTGTAGATYVAALNIAGLKISCDFSPYNYPDSRQPNGVWFVYDDGTAGSIKTVQVVISKDVVQVTPENGASFYRFCYSSPNRFTDRNGNLAPPDPWTTPDGNGNVGPSTYLGATWYTCLLPDCNGQAQVPPCVVSWKGTNNGDRVGTFIAPSGDPVYR